MEEGSEFVERFVNGHGELPLITSCCPAWTDYMEKFAPDFIDSFSSAKSPHAMVGAMSKTYYAEKMGIDPSKIFMVSIMPCTAKKYEITRTDEMYASGHQDIDVSLTTREFSRMIKAAGIDFCESSRGRLRFYPGGLYRCRHHLRRHRWRDGSCITFRLSFDY